MDEIPHLSLPIRYENSVFVTNEQDTDAEAADCVKVILRFERGTRPEAPEFGINDPTFQTQPIDVDDIAEAIGFYEPRVNANITTVDGVDGTSTVSIKVNIPGSDDTVEE